MKELTKTVSIFDEEFEVEAKDGVIDGGEVKVKEVDVIPQSGKPRLVTLNDPEDWDNLEGVLKEYLAASYINQMKEGDKSAEVETCTNNYDEPKVLDDPRAESQREIMVAVANNSPITTEAIDEITEVASSSISNMVKKLKDKGLVQCVGYRDSYQIIQVTPLGLKEGMAIEGKTDFEGILTVDGEGGIEDLF